MTPKRWPHRCWRARAQDQSVTYDLVAQVEDLRTTAPSCV